MAGCLGALGGLARGRGYGALPDDAEAPSTATGMLVRLQEEAYVESSPQLGIDVANRLKVMIKKLQELKRNNRELVPAQVDAAIEAVSTLLAELPKDQAVLHPSFTQPVHRRLTQMCKALYDKAPERLQMAVRVTAHAVPGILKGFKQLRNLDTHVLLMEMAIKSLDILTKGQEAAVLATTTGPLLDIILTWAGDTSDEAGADDRATVLALLARSGVFDLSQPRPVIMGAFQTLLSHPDTAKELLGALERGLCGPAKLQSFLSVLNFSEHSMLAMVTNLMASAAAANGSPCEHRLGETCRRLAAALDIAQEMGWADLAAILMSLASGLTLQPLVAHTADLGYIKGVSQALLAQGQDSAQAVARVEAKQDAVLAKVDGGTQAMVRMEGKQDAMAADVARGADAGEAVASRMVALQGDVGGLRQDVQRLIGLQQGPGVAVGEAGASASLAFDPDQEAQLQRALEAKQAAEMQELEAEGKALEARRQKVKATQEVESMTLLRRSLHVSLVQGAAAARHLSRPASPTSSRPSAMPTPTGSPGKAAHAGSTFPPAADTLATDPPQQQQQQPAALAASAGLRASSEEPAALAASAGLGASSEELAAGLQEQDQEQWGPNRPAAAGGGLQAFKMHLNAAFGSTPAKQ